LILSPHPDDDVISMGGTLCRLVEQGHDVHIAYQVSGAMAVSDEAIWRNLLFARDTGLIAPDAAKMVAAACDAFERNGVLPPSTELKRWKAMARRYEATAAARVCGVSSDRLHFLDLPFYESDSVRRRKVTDADFELMGALLNQRRPHLIYAAGDLDDPHGTHRLCLRALRGALGRNAKESWFGDLELWLYRGSGGGWELDEIDLAVPLSPQEVLRRRRAIFRHETQKDQALFLASDQREFSQRTEERSHQLANAYNNLGLAEYEAMEAFKRVSPDEFLHYDF
jgi:glucosamine-6-phosphate deaminase